MIIRLIEATMGSGMTINDTGFMEVKPYTRCKPGAVYKTVKVSGYYRKKVSKYVK